jgi:hypothetical protein
MLRNALKDVAEGRQPPGADTRGPGRLRPAEGIIEDSLPWQEALKDLLIAQW